MNEQDITKLLELQKKFKILLKGNKELYTSSELKKDMEDFKEFCLLEQDKTEEDNSWDNISGIDFFKTIKESSDCILYENLEDTITILRKFEDKMMSKILNLGFIIYQEISKDYHDNIEEIYYEASWKEFQRLSEDAFNFGVKKQFKELLSNMLFQNQKHKIQRSIDCSLLELFKSGHITWGSLREVVYKDCEI